ncbi:DUF1345 domain-containing protein [Corynebacterium sp. MSK044]|uniref:DUF1345 domain-containing protein n=1 Tax=Corynebacterium sp. MSK044 TaxID=3050195 RepID=UPI00254EC31B|nr:DUF1345 domain-containing protein [Corynebacterium sp. MSK044]MDK8796825.1 DUF1345 domain-containing protein [Corynebacterium sp. MSK044]
MHSEVTRYGASTVAAAVLAVLVMGVFLRGVFTEGQGVSLVVYYLLYWVLYVLIFCGWTVAHLSGRGADELSSYAIAERRSGQKRWVKAFGIKGAANLASIGAFVAMGVAIVLSRIDYFREDWRWLILAGVAVVGAWAFMVLAYAAECLEFDYAARAKGRAPLYQFDHVRTPLFEDYITLALMTSVMGATLPATPTNREAWRKIRMNTAFAYVFNTMIFAMVVSVLSASLSAG